ncbi:hypothetical protein KB206_13215 [Microvirga sp. STS02]|uniref:hypothetical protein n=1 Tax=Hymenobacter negativus TaxID=2795026 RepID=UPI0018DDB084|nr:MULTISPECIES: hypothetical protein [Bacteria]MBH8569846.1 hypothetical protein [Hymenobacter negativus]MBR7209585.1 hypothetical protein [Microvirga sp. STS02]
MQIDFVEPWVSVSSEQASFEEELRRELAPDNVLYGLSLRAIGRRIDCDDVLFEILSGNANSKLVLVHLTWSGIAEARSCPSTKFFANAEEFTAQMLMDEQDYNS